MSFMCPSLSASLIYLSLRNHNRQLRTGPAIADLESKNPRSAEGPVRTSILLTSSCSNSSTEQPWRQNSSASASYILLSRQRMALRRMFRQTFLSQQRSLGAALLLLRILFLWGGLGFCVRYSFTCRSASRSRAPEATPRSQSSMASSSTVGRSSTASSDSSRSYTLCSESWEDCLCSQSSSIRGSEKKSLKVNTFWFYSFAESSMAMGHKRKSWHFLCGFDYTQLWLAFKHASQLINSDLRTSSADDVNAPVVRFGLI